MSDLLSRFKRLRWKLTWSHTWVAAISFLIITSALMVFVMIAVGFNPLQADLTVFNEIVAPVIKDDIKPITTAHLRNQPVDSTLLQADLEQILDNEPLTTSSSLFEIEQFASVFVLDTQQKLLASTPQFTALPPDGQFFDSTLLTGDDSLVPLIEAVYSGNISFEQPYSHTTSEALYLGFAEWLSDETGQHLGVQIVIIRMPTPTTMFLLVFGGLAGGVLIFSLLAAAVGALFGWRTARGFSNRLGELSNTTAAWGQGNFNNYIEDLDKDEIGELGQNLNRVAIELQAMLEDKEKVAILEERDRMARELHDTLAQGVSGLVLQLEAAMHHMTTGEIPESQMIISEAATQARAAMRKARAAIDDLRAEALFAPEFGEVITQRIERFHATTGVAYELDIQLPENLLIPSIISLHARRAISEILANVAHHAEAETVQLRLHIVDGCLLIEVTDDGIGFDVDAVIEPGHYGIIGLKERAQLASGNFSIMSSPGNGTTVQLRLPMEKTP